jgi:hypothetical protein
MSEPKSCDSEKATPIVVEPKAMASGRRCGSCRVCCRLPELPELAKPLDTWCRHVNPDPESEKGCRVFGMAERPQVCAKFKCGWLIGLGEEGDRPDVIGVLMQPTVRGEKEHVLAFVEDRAGALASARAQALMGAWGVHTNGPVVVRKAESRTFLRVPITVNRIVVRPGVSERIAGAGEPRGQPNGRG